MPRSSSASWASTRTSACSTSTACSVRVYVEKVGDRYKLSEAGAREGGLEFAASFEELMKPTHGECSADCWCHNSPDEADACLRDRAMKEELHQHEH
jgi:hypothetical protein